MPAPAAEVVRSSRETSVRIVTLQDLQCERIGSTLRYWQGPRKHRRRVERGRCRVDWRVRHQVRVDRVADARVADGRSPKRRR